MRAWRNRQTHRTQNATGNTRGGSTPSARTNALTIALLAESVDESGFKHRRLVIVRVDQGHQFAGVAEPEDAPGLNPGSFASSKLAARTIHAPVAKRPKAPVLHAGIPPFESGREYQHLPPNKRGPS